MMARTITLLAMAMALALTGCMGPTKAGKEARSAAKERLDLMNSELSYDQAKRAFDVGRFERAERETEAAIAAFPDMPDYHVLMGRIYLETHRLERAIDSFLEAADLSEKLLAKADGKASEELTADIEAKSAEAHYFAGIVFQRWSDDEQAYAHYSRASELDPTSVNYLLATAETLVALGEFESARQLLEPRMEYFEHNSALHHLLGQVALLQGNIVEAEQRMRRAQMLDPEDLFLHEQLARVQYRAEHYEECHDTIVLLEQKLDEPREDLILLRARCMAMLERHDDAREAYSSLTRLDPSNVDVWIELGTIAWEMSDFHRVAQCSIRTISLAPDRFEGYMLKGINERHHGNLQAAIDLFHQSAVRSADSAMPHILLGLALEESGDPEQALIAYSNALGLDPGNAEAASLKRRLEQNQRISAVPETP